MSENKSEKKSIKTEDVTKGAARVLTDKKSRSIVFLIISTILILMINSMLPTIEGNSHYTVNPVEVTYAEYLTMKSKDEHINLTWKSEQDIEKYKDDYIKENPELTEDEKLLITIPDEMRIKVFTQFFYEYTFWYLATGTSLASAVILFYSIFNYLIIRAKERNERYLKLDKEVDTMADNSLDPITFEPWMDFVFNTRRKRAQHVSNIKFKLDKLERKTSYSIKRYFREYYAEDDIEERKEILADLGKLKWKKKKYFNKKEKYLALLDEDYIEQYALDGKVKYFKYIHPMFVQSGVNVSGNTVDSYSLIESDGGRMVKDARTKIILSLASTLILTALFTVTAVGSVDQAPMWFFINIVSKVAPLFLQIPMAFNYSLNFMEGHLIKNLKSRRTIGLLYLADMEQGVSLESPYARRRRIKKEEKRIAEEKRKAKEEVERVIAERKAKEEEARRLKEEQQKKEQEVALNAETN